MAKRGLDNVSFIPSLPYATKSKGEKKRKKERKKSYQYGFGCFVFYYILIISNISSNSMLIIFICFQVSSEGIKPCFVLEHSRNWNDQGFLPHTSAVPIISGAAARAWVCLQWQQWESTPANPQGSTHSALWNGSNTTHFCWNYLALKHQSKG